MSQFPLYSSLSTNLPKKDLTVLQKVELVKRIEEMDNESHELVFALIKSYYLDQADGSSVLIPYKKQAGKDAIDFDLKDLPIPLRQLLYKFINMHKKKLAEDEQIKVLQQV